MAKKPSIPKGTRDFSHEEIARRNYIIAVIRRHFELYGFQPIETPSFENLDTLLGKYGDEGDRLIFKILNSGDFISKVDDITYSSKNSTSLMPKIVDKALRYDLTVPFARYVVMHQNELEFPFKRYQIQPVWRADRPQKGRFREFYQCDADVVGANSLLQELELIELFGAVFTDLGLTGVRLKLNHRKVLAGIAEAIGAAHLLVPFTVALDKLDKVGAEKVLTEMSEAGISDQALESVRPILNLQGDARAQLSTLTEVIGHTENGKEGINQLGELFENLQALAETGIAVELDLTLARGLNYYTGCIFEIAAPAAVDLGSLGGGGRYDDLTGIFGLDGMSGVGISFGLDRIYLAMEALNLFPGTLDLSVQVLCLNFGGRESKEAFKLVQQLRKAGIKTDLYPTEAKMQKQFKYADRRNIPYVILLGENELEKGIFVVKQMQSGKQESYALDKPGDFISVL